ncbi:MAG TPA: hypothetical protein VES42_10380, partial [Pilimelia sp.]|nr:hypothetical protein [Pilimelia sp.]
DPARPDVVVVGYDRRFASEGFAAAAAAVLASRGIEVVLSDRPVPTQLCSFTAHRRGCMALVVTASHNEWLDNGIKIKDSSGAPAAADVLREIELRIPATEVAPPEPAGGVTVADLGPEYVARLRSLVDIDLIRRSPAHLIVDPMHGSGAGWLPAVLGDAAGLRLTEIRTERNPFFGGVNPEPIRPHVDALCAAVTAAGADGGIAFDGDADRVGLVTQSGRFVNQLQVYGLLYWHLLADRGLVGPAVYTLNTTQMVPRLAAAFGTQAYETPVGFKYVGPKMTEVSAVIGGEESGGFGFGFHLPERDGLLAALLLVQLRAQRGSDFDALLRDLLSTFGPSEYDRVDVRFDRLHYDAHVKAMLAELDDRIAATAAPGTVRAVERLVSRDGVKLHLADGSWLLLRFSGTEPVLRIYTEAPTGARVRELLELGRRVAEAG